MTDYHKLYFVLLNVFLIYPIKIATKSLNKLQHELIKLQIDDLCLQQLTHSCTPSYVNISFLPDYPVEGLLIKSSRVVSLLIPVFLQKVCLDLRN